LLLAYHALFDVTTPPLPPLDPLRLRYRDEPAAGTPRPTWSDSWNTIRFWAAALQRSPAVLAAPKVSSTYEITALKDDFLAGAPLRAATLDRAQSQRLQHTAQEARVAVNDLLLRDLFLVLSTWNREHGARTSSLRINVPTSLRNSSDRLLPAANSLGFAFVT